HPRCVEQRQRKGGTHAAPTAAYGRARQRQLKGEVAAVGEALEEIVERRAIAQRQGTRQHPRGIPDRRRGSIRNAAGGLEIGDGGRGRQGTYPAGVELKVQKA